MTKIKFKITTHSHDAPFPYKAIDRNEIEKPRVEHFKEYFSQEYMNGAPGPVDAFHPDNLRFSDFKKIAYDEDTQLVTFETVLSIDGFNYRSISMHAPTPEHMKARENLIVVGLLDRLAKKPDIEILDVSVSDTPPLTPPI